MGIFNRNKKESVRVTNNKNDENSLYYDPISAESFYNEIGDILNCNEINNFRLLKSERNEKFASFDIMSQDSRVASILNMYADDCTQYNQSSQVIWAESSDENCSEFVNRIIKNLQLNKHAWNHIYSLCKYGDLYLELFYDIVDENSQTDLNISASTLLERIEMVKNPASLFDLIKDGKTAYYIQMNTDDQINNRLSNIGYVAQKTDKILPADKFIHISINDAYNRFPNKYVLTNKETEVEEEYDVKEGNSILANVFKTWSELNLLEDSVLLNRLSKSAIIRLIQIEVGNTDDNDVQEILKTLRDKISRNRYLDKSTGEYKNQVNPGPLENIIYHATHKGNGAITHSTMGGDVDVKALADIDHFLEKFAMGFPIPVAYVKQKNDDGGGLSAGTSLTKFDARYGRTLKRYQNAYINGITDLINVFAYRRGVTDYINNFTIKMVSPSAVEDNERDEKLKSHMEIIRDLMDVINGQEESYSSDTKRKLLNYLVQNMLQDNHLFDILQEELIEEVNIDADTDTDVDIQ